MAGLRRVLLGLWLEIRVIPVLLWSFTAITLGTALAWRDGDGISVGGYLAAVAVGVLLQGLVAHCVNEIADWRSGTDRDPSPRVISGGSKVIASGLLGTRELRLDRDRGARSPRPSSGSPPPRRGAGSCWPTGRWGSPGRCSTRSRRCGPPTARSAARRSPSSCIWGCTTGAYVLQRGELSGGAALAGIAYAASCVAMLMMHHYLDRIPDSRALPPKTTTIVLLGGAGRRYAVLWAAIALVGAVPADGAGGRPIRDRRGRLRRWRSPSTRASTRPTRPRSPAPSSP